MQVVARTSNLRLLTKTKAHTHTETILDAQVHVTVGCIHCKTEAFLRDFTKFDKCVEVYSYIYQLCRATGL